MNIDRRNPEAGESSGINCNPEFKIILWINPLVILIKNIAIFARNS